MIGALLLALAASTQASDWALFRGLHASGALELHAADTDLATGLRRRVEPRSGALPLATTVVDAGAATDARAPRVVFARLGGAGHEQAAALLRGVQVVLEDDGFRLFGQSFGKDAATTPSAFAVTREDPERPGRPLTVVVGTPDANVAALFDLERPWWRPMVRVWNRGRRAELPLESPGTELAFDSDAWVPRHAGVWRHVTVPGAPFLPRVASEVGIAGAEYLEAAGRATGLTLVWFGASAPAQLPEVYLIAQAEELGDTQYGLARLCDMDDGAVALVGEALPNDGGAAVAQAMALLVGGEPAELWLRDAVGVAAAGTWWGWLLDDWVGHLASAGLALSLDELVDPRAAARHSAHRLTPLRALLLARLAREEPGWLAALWRDGLAAEERSALGGRLEGWLAEAAEAFAAKENPRRLGDAGVSRGVALAAAERAVALERVRRLGADAVSLSVLVPLEGPPHGAPRRVATGASASDAALTQAFTHARELGMSRLLVLEPLAASTGLRADHVSRTLPEDWEAFFDDYEPCAVHYALLAELLGLETFCFGADLSSALDVTSIAGNPLKREIKRERMLRLLDAVRAAYDGRLTYAVSNAAHLETVFFADRLDLLSAFLFPANRAEAASDGPPERSVLQGRMRHQLQQLRDGALAHARPLLLIQTGFPSSERAWVDARVPGRRSENEVQRMLYEELARALERVAWGEEWFAGLYLWCPGASTAASSGGPGWGYGFLGKPAEAFVPAILGR